MLVFINHDKITWHEWLFEPIYGLIQLAYPIFKAFWMKTSSYFMCMSSSKSPFDTSFTTNWYNSRSIKEEMTNIIYTKVILMTRKNVSSQLIYKISLVPLNGSILIFLMLRTYLFSIALILLRWLMRSQTQLLFVDLISYFIPSSISFLGSKRALIYRLWNIIII